MAEKNTQPTDMSENELEQAQGAGAPSPASGLFTRSFNPQPEPPARVTNGFDPAADLKARGFNPQPEPPAKLFR